MPTHCPGPTPLAGFGEPKPTAGVAAVLVSLAVVAVHKLRPSAAGHGLMQAADAPCCCLAEALLHIQKEMSRPFDVVMGAAKFQQQQPWGHATLNY